MEGEINEFIKVCLSVLTSLSYCYFLVSKIPEGKVRFLTLIPVFYHFFVLPLSFSSICLGSIVSFSISWLASFKLLLFAFGQGPLPSYPSSMSLLRFISICSLPVSIKQNHPSPQITLPPPLNSSLNLETPLNIKNTRYTSTKIPSKPHTKSPLNTAIKLLLFSLLISICNYKQHIHPKIVLLIYSFLVYFFAEIIMFMFALLARALLKLEVEQQFDEPYLSTSLQDFWSRRWNLVVTSILRPAVYEPVLFIFTCALGRRWASLPALMATFLVSGLMHELIYFYITRVEPTWEVTFFFVLHGACMAIEIEAKKVLSGRWRLHPVVSRPLVVGFLAVTGFRLFFPQLLRNGVDTRVIREYSALIEFVKDKWVS